MNETSAHILLQPSLLDRLTDTDPEKRSESRERRVLSPQRLKAAVLRDLGWLLNTGNLDTVRDLTEFPEVRKSVVNFGMPDLSGQTVAGADANELERGVRQAIIDFEPRIDPKSLHVAVGVDKDKMNRLSMTFVIEGDLWAEPMPVPLYLKTAVDLETGDVVVSES